ncbi:GNAT family N-acetyltransferase [Algoriphagus confluentis]|uniref:N-acetyltransferase domain-containing protein n=1 Tax=Algoriphagus confluentis TaxID=1697556 RepID=A0ABQ6PNR1_9BACT|nr:hypothetical protein Aconfl_22430 [Algoriphagus confluentis]
MQIRKGTQEDLPQIIDLLRVSLGESFIPKSLQLWTWKHVENPFGKSPILLAENENQLIGIRAFLRWEFVWKGKTLQACRAVDTAVHPEFQGKGIFTQLTRQLIEQMKKEGIDLIFNTPNSKSTPGYLKMGWEKWNRLPVEMGFCFDSFLSVKKQALPSDWTSVELLVRQFESQKESGQAIKTHARKGYIFWRYRDCPIFQYQVVSDEKNYLLIYRIKENAWGKEFRICDFFISEDSSAAVLVNAKQALKSAIIHSGAKWISQSGLLKNNLNLRLSATLPIGPWVTLREMKAEIQPASLPWAWSLGDLELF